MGEKSIKTTKYIIKTVAPLFNRYGFIGTSMSQLTEATNLTKGAIYGNFKNKEALAIASFRYLAAKIVDKLEESINEKSSEEKLQAILDFYKNYNVFTAAMGGCPIINFGTDAQNNNNSLAQEALEAQKEIEQIIARVFAYGEEQGVYKLPVSDHQYAKQFLTIINGGIVSATITRDKKYLTNTINYLSSLLKQSLFRNKLSEQH